MWSLCALTKLTCAVELEENLSFQQQNLSCLKSCLKIWINSDSLATLSTYAQGVAVVCLSVNIWFWRPRHFYAWNGHYATNFKCTVFFCFVFLKNRSYFRQKVSRRRVATGLLYTGTTPLTAFYHVTVDTALCLLLLLSVPGVIAAFHYMFRLLFVGSMQTMSK